MKWVKTFRTSEEAINYFFESQSLLDDPKLSKKDITRILLTNFPKALKQESIQNFYNALTSYQNKLSSQSLPKCTLPTPEEMEAEHDKWLETPNGEYCGWLDLSK